VAGYSRYVAIGDSHTEGLWDGDDTVGLRGFADRLAEIVDTHYPGLTYANLAVRGGRIRDVLDSQLPQALAMDPDLVTVCIGMNDVTTPGPHFDRALAELDDLHAQLARSGATVATTTFPDLTRILPVGRLLGTRMLRINDAIRAAANRPRWRSQTPGAPTGYTGRRRVTPFSRPRPPRHSDCRAATMIGPTPTAAPCGNRCGRWHIHRRFGRRTCSCHGSGVPCAAALPAKAAVQDGHDWRGWSL
jgi:lysophospholipase L1-like esterase